MHERRADWSKDLSKQGGSTKKYKGRTESNRPTGLNEYMNRERWRLFCCGPHQRRHSRRERGGSDLIDE